MCTRMIIGLRGFGYCWPAGNTVGLAQHIADLGGNGIGATAHARWTATVRSIELARMPAWITGSLREHISWKCMERAI